MAKIVFIFPIFSQLSRIFSRRTRSRYAMRFTFKVRRAEQKERAKNCPIKAFLADSIAKAPYAAGWSKYPVRMRLLLCFFSRSGGRSII